MTRREQLQLAYELAFFPPRLNEVWRKIKSGDAAASAELGAVLDMALLLHQALPEDRQVSQRALQRLATYQARARAFGTVRFLRNLHIRLGRPPLAETVVPPHLVRDVGLPELAHSSPNAERYA